MSNKNNSFEAIALLLAALGAGTAFGWHVFKGTPRYSLSQLQTAMQESDRAAIQEYIDAEAISTQIVDTAVQTIQQETAMTGDIFGQLGASLGIGMIETIRPLMEQQIEQYINNELTKSAAIEPKEIKLVSIKNTGNKRAIATFDVSKIPNSEQLEKQSISIILKQQSNRNWKIVGLSEETLAMFSKLVSQN